jgi:long-subunit fatty acid transport protein
MKGMKKMKEMEGMKKMEMFGMKILFFSFFSFLSFPSFSQSNNTNSPYTRYGYGQLADQSSISQRGMGGIGYGLRNSQLINPLNPASYSAVDSMTFMFDLGLKGQVGWFEDNLNKATKYNAGLEYVALQFPLAKGLGMGIGFEPLSYVGYQYLDTTNMEMFNEIAFSNYSGKGGFNKLYGTLSYRLLDRLSLGVNVGYLFGDVIHSCSASFNSTGSLTNAYRTYKNDTIRSNNLTYEFGLQYIQPVSKNAEIIIGAVYTPKTRLGATVNTAVVSVTSAGQITGEPNYWSSNDSVFQLPETYALGISYHKFNKWTVGADFQYQRWADAKYYDKTDEFSNRMKINVGAEFVHKLRYRAGAYYTDSYVKNINNASHIPGGYKEYGASLGLGIPMVDKRSFINMAFEYSLIRPDVKTMIDEQYFKFSVSYTFNELWFFKRKLQ